MSFSATEAIQQSKSNATQKKCWQNVDIDLAAGEVKNYFLVWMRFKS